MAAQNSGYGMSDEGERALDVLVIYGDLAQKSMDLNRSPRGTIAVPMLELRRATEEVVRLRGVLAKVRYIAASDAMDGAAEDLIREALDGM